MEGIIGDRLFQECIIILDNLLLGERLKPGLADKPYFFFVRDILFCIST